MRLTHSLDWKSLSFATLCFLSLFILLFGGWKLTFYLYEQYEISAPATNSALTFMGPNIQAAIPLLSLVGNSERVINSLTIADAVPQIGKFIAADLESMTLYLYKDGVLEAQYPILTKGKPGTPWETPSGFYSVRTKEESHFSSIGKVYMPFSMQFYGNYFIHGWPYYTDGTPVASTYSGGCIRLNTEDAEEVFAFADPGTGLFVYDPKTNTNITSSLSLAQIRFPSLAAASYVVADIDTGDVFAENNAQYPQEISSLTKLITGLVANETISFDKNISIDRGILLTPEKPSDMQQERFPIGEVLYPLLMKPSDTIANILAAQYGKKSFVKWMNTTAQALDMSSTHFSDPSGIGADNVSTPDDLYRLTVYFANKKSFIFKITSTSQKTLTATDGSVYTIKNSSALSGTEKSIGMENAGITVITIPINGTTRRVVIIVLGSPSYASDVQKLSQWIKNSAIAGAKINNEACISCATSHYRKIAL